MEGWDSMTVNNNQNKFDNMNESCYPDSVFRKVFFLDSDLKM